MNTDIPAHPVGLLAALRHFFGLKTGQSLQDFAGEVKALDDSDRAYFKRHLEAAGYSIS